ncbi:hypothetical protein [Burkholderia sp. Bp8992]|uniref:hypothetical protein n=1 Tax=Burkholderia sp. Bp8992 TaxID=2184554 RepID=UPI001629CA4E|nr:hypothetical protein [Burkholderia sp. Bp8992]
MTGSVGVGWGDRKRRGARRRARKDRREQKRMIFFCSMPRQARRPGTPAQNASQCAFVT